MLAEIVDRCMENDEAFDKKCDDRIKYASNKSDFCYWTFMSYFCPWFFLFLLGCLSSLVGFAVSLAVFPIHTLGFIVAFFVGYWHKNCSIKWAARG
jgi:hypothetical protein